MALRHFSWILLVVWGCTTSSATSRPAGAEESRAGLAFIHDDYGAALRMAREKHLPVFVDAGTVWCHSCRSMSATVLTDPALQAYADRFIWLAIDTDNPANEDFLRRFPVEAFPTLFVLEPERETLLSLNLGALSVPQLTAFLDQAGQAFRQGLQGATELIARADTLATTGAHAEAAAAYQQALSKLPQDSSLRATTTVSLIKSLSVQGRWDDCMRLSTQELSHLSRADDRARVLYAAVGCSLDSKTEAAAAQRASLAEQISRALQTPADALLPTARSSLYEALVELRQFSGDEAAVATHAADWLAFIEESARSARNAQERSVLDVNRMMAAMIIGKPERAIPAIEQSARELPGDYSPPTQLAMLYLETGKLDQALQASDRALALAKGAARGQVLALRARILLARGERTQAERLLTEELRTLESVPEGYAARQQRKMLERTLGFLRTQRSPASGAGSP
jgi:tetratricopeptide (TPR) repeat protein